LEEIMKSLNANTQQQSIAVDGTVRVYRILTPDHECPWGIRAIKLLTEKGIKFEDHLLRSREAVDEFKAQYNVATTPQIFFGEQRIGGYTDLAAYFDVAAAPEYSYTPVIALFSTAGLMTLATSLGMTGFMGISLSMLAALKLMDLEAFAESFRKYDLLTRRFRPYGRAYPSIELLLGLGYLSGVAPLATGIVSLLVGMMGGISVFKAVYIDKMALNCACVGGNSKAPLGVVSFAENAIMAGMGAMLLFTAANPNKLSPKADRQQMAPISATQPLPTSQNLHK
jgi:glutaredoxin